MAKEKEDGVTIEAVAAVQQLQAAEAHALATDTRPRTVEVQSILGTDLVFGRWTPEQSFVIRQRLEGIGHKSNSITVNDANRGHCIKAIQIGLRNPRFLAFPGEEGFNQIGRLPNAELGRLASEALKFNEVFNG